MESTVENEVKEPVEGGEVSEEPKLNEVDAGETDSNIEGLDLRDAELGKKYGLIKEENNELIVTQTLKNPPGEVTEIVYGEIKGRHKVAMDGKGDDTNYSKIYALLGAISGQGPKAYTSLKGVDVSISE